MEKISFMKVRRQGFCLTICVNSSAVSDSGRSFPFHNGEYSIAARYSTIEEAVEAVQAISTEFVGSLDGINSFRKDLPARLVRPVRRSELEEFLLEGTSAYILEDLQEA